MKTPTQEIQTPCGTVNIYAFNKLNDTAKEKARDWYKTNDFGDDCLPSQLEELIKERLEAQGYYADITNVFYSLSYSQGDGVSFTGTLQKDGITYRVKQRGSYVHENTMNVEQENEDGETDDATEVLEMCKNIAKEAEKAGYTEIDYQNSDECVDENITMNGYTFTKKGTRMDYEN